MKASCSTFPPGGNHVDGLPPARNQLFLCETTPRQPKLVEYLCVKTAPRTKLVRYFCVQLPRDNPN